MQHCSNLDRWMSCKELCALLRISRWEVAKKVLTGAIAVRLSGARRLYRVGADYVKVTGEFGWTPPVTQTISLTSN